jgi:hypothetical protein
MKTGLHLFWMMFVQYAVLTFNTRAIAGGHYLALFITDVVVACLGFTILKKVEEANGPLQMACYALGGSIGAQVALWFSMKFM